MLPLSVPRGAGALPAWMHTCIHTMRMHAYVVQVHSSAALCELAIWTRSLLPEHVASLFTSGLPPLLDRHAAPRMHMWDPYAPHAHTHAAMRIHFIRTTLQEFPIEDEILLEVGTTLTVKSKMVLDDRCVSFIILEEKQMPADDFNVLPRVHRV